MEPPDDIDMVHDARYLNEGPNSGGENGWYLRDGHMFRYDFDGRDGSVDPGIPVARWLDRWRDVERPRIAAIVTDLATRGYA